MLRQEELAFIKALSNVEVFPLFLRELKKAVAAGKKKALAAHKANASAGERPSGVGEACTSRDPLLLSAPKRKAEELSGSDCPSEPASRRPAPEHPLDNGPSAQGTTGEKDAQSSRQLGPSEGRLAYASGGWDCQPAPAKWDAQVQAKVSVSTETAASSEAAPRRMSLGDMSGPLCGMPQGTTSSDQVDNAAAPATKRQNRTPIYVTGVTDTRSFLSWLRALCPSGLFAQIKGERLMLVPATAAGFRTTVTALRSLDASRGVSFHTFSLPEDRCVRLLVRNLGRHARRRRPGGAGESGHPCPGSASAPLGPSRSGS